MDPSEDLIAHWKKQYKNIYSVSIRKQEYIFRALTFAEFDEAVAEGSESSADAEEEIIYCAILWPHDINLDKLPAGTVTSLAEEVMEVSRFTDIKTAREALDEKRTKSSLIKNLMKAFVIATMPTYRPNELDNLTFDDLAELVALAEQILRIQQAVTGTEGTISLNLIDPEEQAEIDKHTQESEFLRALKNNPETEERGTTFGAAPVYDPIAQQLHGLR